MDGWLAGCSAARNEPHTIIFQLLYIHILRITIYINSLAYK